MTDVLGEINSPKRIENADCLRMIADIMRFCLTLFVHEEVTDYRLLAAILDCSSCLFS